MSQCMICKCVEAMTNAGSNLEQAFAEGFVMGVITQRAVPEMGVPVTAFLCSSHLEYCRQAANVGAKANPSVAKFCNFGLTVVK